MKTAIRKAAIWLPCVLSLRVPPYTVHSKLQYRSSSVHTGSNEAAASFKLYTGDSGEGLDDFSPSTSNPVAPKFPYGVSGFKTIMTDKSFYVDKTSYIRTLETSGQYLKMWRPRHFGKTHVCDMLAEYYDAANSADQLKAMFGETDIMRKQLTTTEMGKYLVLRLSFSDVGPDKDIKRNFRDCINGAVLDFSEKYVEAGLLDGPIDVDREDCMYSLGRLFSKVEISGRQIYLIVDECDSFVNHLLMSVDTSKPDLGLKEYKDVVSDKESMLRSWGNVIKGGTVRSIARAFITGVVPPALSDSLSGLDMVKDITFYPEVSGLFGLTAADVSRGLGMIDLTPDLHTKHLEHIWALYGGYCFTRTQTYPLFSTQNVLYYLDRLDRTGSPPKSLIDPAVSGSTDSVAGFIIANNERSPAPFASLRNFAVGIIAPDEMETFQLEEDPSFNSKALFDAATVRASLIALAYFHGFLTHRLDKESNSIVLTSPNAVMKAVFIRTLLPEMPEKYMKQMEATLYPAVFPVVDQK